MQYESIILEMMSRIQKLEDEVKELKSAFGNQDLVETNFCKPKRKNVKVTPEMTEICYNYAKIAYEQRNIDINDLASKVSKDTGMNENTAKMNIGSIKAMLEGVEFNRILSSQSLRMCLEFIYRDYGVVGHKKALSATRGHIRYLNSINQPASNLVEVCDEFEDLVK